MIKIHLYIIYYRGFGEETEEIIYKVMNYKNKFSGSDYTIYNNWLSTVRDFITVLNSNSLGDIEFIPLQK